MGKCFLLIIPFSSMEECERKEFKCFARNVLEVDDEYYEDLLDNYKLRIYKEIRKRGHFIIIDDGSCEKELSRMLLNSSPNHKKVSK